MTFRLGTKGSVAALALVVAIPVTLSVASKRAHRALGNLAPTVTLSLERNLQDSLRSPVISRPSHIVIEALPPAQVPVSLANVNTDETATFEIDVEGGLTPNQQKAVAHFFR